MAKNAMSLRKYLNNQQICRYHAVPKVILN